MEVCWLSAIALCLYILPIHSLKISLAKRNLAYDGKKISDSALWTWSEMTRIRCVATCYKDVDCRSVQFSSVSSTCTAFGHAFKGVSVSTEAAAGYQLFLTAKPSPFPNCDVDADCNSLTNAHCNNGICRCDIGFSIDGTTCRKLTECIKFSKMSRGYEGRSIKGFNIGTAEDQTPESCQQLCIDNPSCKTVDFHIYTHKCFPSDKTWFDVSASSRGTSADYYSFQRECDW